MVSSARYCASIEKLERVRHPSKSFHEKAGECQVGFSPSGFFSFEPGRLCRHPSIRTLLGAMVRSVQVGRPHFSRCCYLRIDLGSHFSSTGVGPGLGRSHLNSAVELGSSDPTLRHGAYPFTVLIFSIAGLLSIAPWARQSLGTYRIPPETGPLIQSDKSSRKLALCVALIRATFRESRLSGLGSAAVRESRAMYRTCILDDCRN